MKKNYQFIFLIFVLSFVSACSGYKPIFQSTNIEFKIGAYSVEGDKILGSKIYSKLHNLSKSQKNKQNVSVIDLAINVTKNKEGTSKDTSGKILEYKVTLITKVEIKELYTYDKILNQKFTTSTTYKVQEQYSDTINMENKAVENLLDKTYQDLLIRLSENINIK